MLKLNPNPTFKADVPLTIPGEINPVVIHIEFRHKSKTALKEWTDGAETRDMGDMLEEVIASWSGVDEPFSRGALDKLLENSIPAAAEIVRAYMSGLTESKVKN